MNKIDMDSAMIDEVKDQIVDLLGCDPDSILAASGKTKSGNRAGARSDHRADSGPERRRTGSASGVDFRLGVQSVPRNYRLLPNIQRHAPQGRARRTVQYGQRVYGRRGRRTEAEDASPRRASRRRRGLRRIGPEDFGGREGRRYDHCAAEPLQRGDRRFRGRQADGVRRAVSGRSRTGTEDLRTSLERSFI